MNDPQMLRGVARASAMVLEMGILVVGGVFAGSWLDEALNTSPLMLLLLSTGMLVVGIVRIHHIISRLESSHDPPDDDS